jgi:cell division transport system permease protein
LNKDEPILLESITASILPASLEVKTKDLADLSTISGEVSGLDGVEEVRFFEDVVARFKFWSNVVYIVGFVLVAAFLVISYSVVISTLRTTIHSKGVELEIMKLVGASDKYVKMPLVYQGIFFGLISSFIASLFIILLGVLASKFGIFSTGITFGFLYGFYVSPLLFTIILSVSLILSGVLLGLVGSNTAVKRYLNY